MESHQRLQLLMTVDRVHGPNLSNGKCVQEYLNYFVTITLREHLSRTFRPTAILVVLGENGMLHHNPRLTR